MTTFVVREAHVDDASLISDLVLELMPALMGDTLRELPEPVYVSLTTDGCRARILDSDYHSWVALFNDDVIGYGAIREKRHLYHLFVAKQHQKRGVASALWSAMLPVCGPGPVTVWSSRNAVPVYRQFGFLENGELGQMNGLYYQPMILARDVSENLA